MKLLSSTKSSSIFRQSAIALMLATLLVLTFGSSARANWLETLRSIFTGDTGEGAQGNARGGAIRDRRCSAETLTTFPQESADATPSANALIPDAEASSTLSPESESLTSSTDAIASDKQLILLVPNTGQTITTTTALPEIFVYIPPSANLEEQQSSLISEPMSISYQNKIDINDIDSVVDEDVQHQIEQTQQSELLLELQFDGKTSYYSLPDEAMIARLQAPEDTTFEVGETSTLEVRLICQQRSLSSLSSTAEIELSNTTETEVFVDIQRVESSHALMAAMETYSADKAYQAYLENGLWLEMVVSLATNPGSPEWAELLRELEIPSAVDPIPQPLILLTD